MAHGMGKGVSKVVWRFGGGRIKTVGLLQESRGNDAEILGQKMRMVVVVDETNHGTG